MPRIPMWKFCVGVQRQTEKATDNLVIRGSPKSRIGSHGLPSAVTRLFKMHCFQTKWQTEAHRSIPIQSFAVFAEVNINSACTPVRYTCCNIILLKVGLKDSVCISDSIHIIPTIVHTYLVHTLIYLRKWMKIASSHPGFKTWISGWQTADKLTRPLRLSRYPVYLKLIVVLGFP